MACAGHGRMAATCRRSAAAGVLAAGAAGPSLRRCSRKSALDGSGGDHRRMERAAPATGTAAAHVAARAWSRLLPAGTICRFAQRPDDPMPANPFEPDRSLRCPLAAHRRRAHGAGHRSALHRRTRAADHRRLFRQGRVSARAHPGDGGTRPARLVTADRIRLCRHECGQLRIDLPGTGARRFGHPQFRLGAVVAVHVSDLCLRQRRAAPALAAGYGRRQGDRLLRPDRTARRLGSGQHENACEKGRRRLDLERRQDVDHQRQPRAHRHRLGADRRRHPGLPGREGFRRFHGAGNPQEDEPARIGDLGAVFRQRARAGGQSPAEREGVEGVRSAASRRRATASPGARLARRSPASPKRPSTPSSACCSSVRSHRPRRCS